MTHSKLLNKFFIIAVGFILLLLLSAGVTAQSHKQNTDYILAVTSNNATSCNLSSIIYPDNTQTIFNTVMVQDGRLFYLNITSGNYSQIGETCHNIVCTDGATYEDGSVCVEVTPEGKETTGLFSIVIIASLIAMGAFSFILGLVFNSDHWMLKNGLFIIAILFGILALNSARIISYENDALSTMMDTGLIIGIGFLMFLFAYLFIVTTKAVITSLKNAKKGGESEFGEF